MWPFASLEQSVWSQGAWPWKVHELHKWFCRC